MPIRAIIQEIVVDAGEMRLSEVERQVEELRETIDRLMAVIDVRDDEVRIHASEIEIEADVTLQLNSGANISIDAGASLDVTAGTYTCNAAMAQFTGVVRCDTIIATTVTGATYTPGAGNLW